MASIVWSESIPSGTSLAGNAPLDFPRVWKAISSGMTLEHYWDASGGASAASAGDLRPGASRVHQVAAIQSMATTSQITGQLALILTDSRNSNVPYRIHTYDSAGTYLIGSGWMDEHATDCGTGYWLRQSGSVAGIATGTGTTTVTFPVPYLGAPTVFYTLSNASWLVWTWLTAPLFGGAPFGDQVISAYSSRAGASGTLTLYWESLGTVSSASY